MKKSPRLTSKHLSSLIEEAVVDAYTETEQVGGFFTMIDDQLALPLATRVVGVDVAVVKIDVTARDEIAAVWSRGKWTQAIPILDLPLPDPLPAGAEWITFGRYGCRR